MYTPCIYYMYTQVSAELRIYNYISAIYNTVTLPIYTTYILAK